MYRFLFRLRQWLFGTRPAAPVKKPQSKRNSFSLELEELLGFAPQRIELYEQAFTHASVVREFYRQHRTRDDSSKLHNERLEFLGDAVLETIVSEHLYSKFPDKREGFLTQLRSKIVGRSALEKLAKDLDLKRFIKAAPGNGAKNLGGNVMEALAGAIYLDKGYECARTVFLGRLLLPHVNIDQLLKQEYDYKSRLLEATQKRGQQAVFGTEMVMPEKKGEQRKFCCTLQIGEDIVGRGEGLSKKEAEQRAAEQAFTRLSLQRR